MKKFYSAFLFLVLLTLSVCAQDKGQKIPSVKIKNMDGKVFDTDSITNGGKPIIISFWATWCKPCVNELNTIAEEYSDWQAETGVKLIAISIDDARSSSSVKPFVSGKNWDYEIYLDPNGDFKRAMNVNTVPHTFLINGNREIISQHTSFSPGDEDKLLEDLKKANAPKSVKE
jgi:cytochrome c biogenesis protein CcmG/thiol:disulfide interchange protein DsbE